VHGVWFVARVAVRRRWTPFLALAVVVGIAGGGVLAAASGARRTASSLDRFAAATRPGHVQIGVGTGAEGLPAEVARLPEVEAFARFVPVSAFLDVPDYVPVAANVDARFGRRLDVPRLVAGRLPNPARPREVALPETAASLLRVGVGDTLRMLSFTPEQSGAMRADEDADVGDPAGPTVRLQVVGIGRSPADLSAGGTDVPPVVLTPAFLRRYGNGIGRFADVDIYRVRLRDDASARAFVNGFEQAAGPRAVVDVEPLGYESAGVQDSIDALASGLWIFAAIAAVAALMAIGQVIGRQVFAAGSDDEILRAIGLGPRQRLVGLAAPFFAVGAIGALIAVAFAFAASPLTPIGVARDAEPDPGLWFDSAALGVGFVTVLVIVSVLALVSAWRVVASSASEAERRGADGVVHASRVASRLARAGAPATTVTGVRLAFERGRGRTAVPVRSALAGASLGVAGVVATLLFAANLNVVVDTPRSYGWNWDVTASGPDLEAEQLISRRDIRAVGEVRATHVRIRGRPVEALGFQDLRGSTFLTVIDGRAPRAPEEIALGAETLDAHGLHIGDHVRAAGRAGSARFQIVGQVVFPPLDDNFVLADGAAFTERGLASLVENDDLGEGGFSQFAVRWAPGVDEQVAIRQLGRLTGEGVEGVDGPRLPAELEKLTQLDRLPYALAAFLALLAVVALAHALVTSVRRRRIDFAILRTLGFTSGQVRVAVGWQATVVAAFGVIIGLPLGIVIGRVAWAVVAEGLGVATDVVVPALALMVLVAAVLIVANVIAGLPGRAAARTSPAVVLRAE
jgi:ABC-type lipoprotein release transport system permease subunit